jgi:hypothetical protein
MAKLFMHKSTDMKKKNLSKKAFTPMSAVVAGCALAAVGAQAQTPLFDATFPASWNGTGTTVVNQDSSAAVGFQSGTATYSTTAVPAGAAAGTGSMALTGGGGIKVTPAASLDNTDVANDGGFTYNAEFLWNGAVASNQKVIDYAGTESLEINGATGTLSMSFGTGNGTTDTGGTDVPVISTAILPNTWYNVTMTFNTGGAPLVNGDISGVASLYLNGNLVSTAATTKGTYGDSLDRPIGIGEFGYGHTTSILGLNGDIYNASVDLGVDTVVPEPSSLALGVMGGLSSLGMMWNGRRRKS